MPTIAVIGASPDRAKFGNKCVRAHAKRGYTVYPINPKADEIEGFKAYKSLAEVPLAELDRVSIYLSEPICLPILPEIAAKQVGEVWFNPGADSPAVLQKARELGLHVVVGCSIVDLGLSPGEFA